MSFCPGCLAEHRNVVWNPTNFCFQFHGSYGASWVQSWVEKEKKAMHVVCLEKLSSFCSRTVAAE
ncbi:hypothetical protein HanRHA438_Chr06g0252571 [Helianthus annuus]|nr:hypothetical protein HanRHA438_Chr06g0252571 [Helianthus annuus]